MSVSAVVRSGSGRGPKLSVLAKLLGSSGIVIVLLIAVGVIGINGMSSINRTTDALVKGDVAPILALSVAQRDFETNKVLVRDVILETNPALMDASIAKIKVNAAGFSAKLAEASKTMKTPAELKVLAEINGPLASYTSLRDKAVTLGRANKTAEAYTLLKAKLAPVGLQISTGLDHAFTLESALTDQSAKTVSSTYASNRTLSIIMIVIGALLGFAVAFWIARGMKRGIAEVLDRMRNLDEHCLVALSDGLAAVAVADLTKEAVPTTTPVEKYGRDEVGDLAVTFNKMLGKAQYSIESYNAMRIKLTEIIGEISNGSESVSAASQEMASTSEETGRAVAEIATAVTNVAQGAEQQVLLVDRTKQVTDESGVIAGQAHEAAEQGVATVEKADAAMRSVRESSAAVSGAINALAGKSEQIGGIVETITGIAGQTNLLALNAAIEAARAGEQGRGFAVVAEEVRKLAEESQQAAATIASIVAEIQTETEKAVAVVEDGAKRTEEGVRVVGEARTAFEAIGGSVEEIRTKIGQIIDAATEVAAVAEQSSAATEQVSASTQQTSASAQEIAASAQELAKTAEGLQALVSQFKLVA
jgi:methyl-accepting chemotaxis protein